ncbi:MFS general substrate transporter [Panaeolus papilionaceus]|nr:MFS general substrate transporter [Panaeolus papilionaceus]
MTEIQSEAVINKNNYDEKIEAVNLALKDIGMGRYQWTLFILTGFGYFAGNLWPTVAALILPPVMSEFKTSDGPFLKLGQNIGLLVGAVFWGVGADIWGRKLSFNINLLITGLFGIAAGFSPNFTILAFTATLWSLGIGGNMPIDAAIFLEFIPSSHQYLLTVLSIWWTLGQFTGSLIAWPLIGKFSCPSSMTSDSPSSICDPNSNKGWRYFLFTMGGLTLLFWVIRVFLFRISETPKYLVGRGRDVEAVEVLEKVAKLNGSSRFCIDREKLGICVTNNTSNEKVQESEPRSPGVRAGWLCQAKGNHLQPLFETMEKAVTTSLLISIWALVGLAYPLYMTFGDGSVNTTYRNQVILSVIGIPASLLAGYMVSLPFIGRRGTLAIFTLLSGAFILLSTTSRSSNALLGWNCAYTFTNNVMYGALYAMTNEIFDSKDRGTASALTSGANRIFGIMAPVVALYADLTTSLPIFIAGVIFLVAGVLPVFIPVETRDQEAK